MHGEHHPLSEPPPSSGSGGSSGSETTDLALATPTRVKRRISDGKSICLFAFYGNNAVVAVRLAKL